MDLLKARSARRSGSPKALRCDNTPDNATSRGSTTGRDKPALQKQGAGHLGLPWRCCTEGA
eukprot:366022-Chlamydomonas_euryale.AAC.6